jgi:outer membrane protein TolC
LASAIAVVLAGMLAGAQIVQSEEEIDRRVDSALQTGGAQEDSRTPEPAGPKPAGSAGAKAGEGPASAVDVSPPRGLPKTIQLRLSLADAVRRGLEQNPEIRISRQDAMVRKRELIVQKSLFDPFFIAGATFSKNRRPTASFLDVGGAGVRTEAQVNPFEVTTFYGGFRGSTILGTDYQILVEESGFDRPLASSGNTPLFGFNPQEETSARFELTQPLLKGAWYAYNSAGIRLAASNEKISREALERTASDVVFRIEQAYWQLVFAEKNFESKSNALSVTNENLENTRRRRTVGTLAPIDVTTAESQAALRKVELGDAELLMEDSRDALLELLHHGGDALKERWDAGEKVESFDDIGVETLSAPDPSVFLPNREEALQKAFDRRADYHQVLARIENQRIQVEVAKNEQLPALNLTGSWRQQGLDDSIEGSFSSLGSGQFYSWSVGVQLEIPLFPRGPRNNYLRAKELLVSLLLQKTQLENRIVIEVDQSLRKLSLVRRKVEDLEERVRLQRLLLEGERRKLDAGKSIPYAVSLIENDLVESEAQALRAKADYETAKAEYYHATGTLLERHGVEAGP